MLNPRLDEMMTYPFDRLRALLGGIVPPDGVEPISLSLGEPRHAPPAWAAEVLAEHAADWSRYPPNRGTAGFRDAVAEWLGARYGLPAGFVTGESNVLPCAGTREAIFMFALVAVPPHKTATSGPAVPAVLVPNPLYHVYAGAAQIAGAEAVFVPALPETRFLPDFTSLPVAVLRRTVLAYLCSPGNPQGMAATLDELKDLIALAIEHDFIVAVDECYSEIYDRDPPAGALQAAAAFGAKRAEALNHVVVFNSLSKRSSAPGLRSGFVAGGPDAINAFARLRAYASCQMPIPVLRVAARLWRDEGHVARSREAYRAKFDTAQDVLDGRFGFYRPDGGFFLWLDVGDGERAAARLWAEAGVRVLPGACLCPDGDAHQRPGRPYIRIALVHEPDTIAEALTRLGRVLN